MIKPLSLRAWLYLISLGAVLPLTVFSGYSLIQAQAEQQQETIAGLGQRSENIVRTVDQRLSVVVSSLVSLAERTAARLREFGIPMSTRPPSP